MRVLSITQGLLFGLLASAPLSAGYVVSEPGEKRHVGSLASYASHAVRDLLPRHHTEAQIAAKEAAAAATSNNNGATGSTTTTTGHHKHQPQNNQKRDPHHTEAQIAAKEAAAARSGKNDKRSPQVPPPDEFGPWDSTEDEFGSWVNKREPHHTEAQIAAKEAAATNSRKNGKRAPQTPPPDEFGPWDSTEDEFGSWVDKREPHHTEAQIAAKEKAAAAKSAGQKREPHHTEAQIAAKEKAAAKAGHERREPHHTEAQIAAKEKAAAAKAASNHE